MKETREQKRNRLAENVCRELRYYLAGASVAMDDKPDLMTHLLKWMKVAKKSKYDRPE